MADPLVAGQYGKAAFDSVDPLLLIGWAEVGPVLLQTIASIRRQPSADTDSPYRPWHRCRGDGRGPGHEEAPKHRGMCW